jgi:hypothetical protein
MHVHPIIYFLISVLFFSVAPASNAARAGVKLSEEKITLQDLKTAFREMKKRHDLFVNVWEDWGSARAHLICVKYFKESCTLLESKGNFTINSRWIPGGNEILNSRHAVGVEIQEESDPLPVLYVLDMYFDKIISVDKWKEKNARVFISDSEECDGFKEEDEAREELGCYPYHTMRKLTWHGEIARANIEKRYENRELAKESERRAALYENIKQLFGPIANGDTLGRILWSALKIDHLDLWNGDVIRSDGYRATEAALKLTPGAAMNSTHAKQILDVYKAKGGFVAQIGDQWRNILFEEQAAQATRRHTESKEEAKEGTKPKKGAPKPKRSAPKRAAALEPSRLSPLAVQFVPSAT